MTYCPRCWRRYRVSGRCTDCKVVLEEPTTCTIRIELIRRIGQEALEATVACRSRGHRYPCQNCDAIAASALEEVQRLLPTRN
ncbi:hypothetical protein HY635_00145 [Candidatus Uhrbacteria bacterium]|nr:hypothetical protein [Candidatus Uhrbacteria bacterium]